MNNALCTENESQAREGGDQSRWCGSDLGVKVVEGIEEGGQNIPDGILLNVDAASVCR